MAYRKVWNEVPATITDAECVVRRDLGMSPDLADKFGTRPVTYTLNDQQFEAVRTLPTQQRYDHLVKRAADWGELLVLRADDGWVMAADDAGIECVPVWPHPRYAEASATGPWAGSTAVPIGTREWIDGWTPDLVSASRLVAVFPVDGQPNATIDPKVFADDLSSELARLESVNPTRRCYGG